MSYLPAASPDADMHCPAAVEMAIVPRTSDIGGLDVRRALPFRDKRMVGPFVFWDEMGPGEFLTGQGVDVRPHPHIGLSTVTYLTAGALDHRDSLGTFKTIRPGDVNLMSAGRGIAHSERTGSDERAQAHTLAGVQSWLAQPMTHEEGVPAFAHHGAAELPRMDTEGIRLRLILGQGHWGLSSPVATQWDSLYADVHLDTGALFPLPRQVEERAIYVLSGEIEIGGAVYPPHQMLVLKPGADAALRAVTPVHLMVLGGAVMDGPRYIWWNFVASRRDRIMHAAEAWRNGTWAGVPDDADSGMPLPGVPKLAPIAGAADQPS
jgi:redox-sensitive bicupin YhaK (pirin superfamily)